MKKTDNSYKTIGEVAEILNLSKSQNSKNSTHTIRFWEKEFKQIKPKIINKRRYYDKKNMNILKKIHFLLKNQGMTISGVKKYLNNENFDIDGKENKIINHTNLKFRLNKINNLIKEIKEK